MALTELNTYTINDIYNLPDGQRAELIDGKVYYMAPATRNHQRIVGELFATIQYSRTPAERYLKSFVV